MKSITLKLISASLALAIMPVHSSHAVDAGSANVSQISTGTLEGRVQNEFTGRYLNNARISVKGSKQQVFTDETGSFRLVNVPSGPVVIEVYYTGLETQEIPLTIPGNQSVRRDIKLNPPGQGVVQLNPYAVEASRITDQAIIAVNEQRFAPNIKNVVATGDLSEHADGNIGEFLKFVPGLYGAADQRQIGALSVRGLPSNYTQVTIDGAATADAQLAGTSRTVELQYSMSSENVARVEVTKMPTPSKGADTMAGSVNMISRSAFESVRAEFKYQVNLTGDHEHISLKPEAIGLKKDMYYLRPSMSFAYTNPVSENFGFVITGMFQSRWTPQNIYNTGFVNNSATFGSTLDRPVNTGATYTSAAGMNHKTAIAFTADWRPAPNSVVSGTIQAYTQDNQNISYVLAYNTGSIATPTVAGAANGSYGEDYTIGALGQGRVNFRNNFADTARGGFRGNARYGFNNGDWKIDLQVGYSQARTWLRGPEKGIGNNLAVQSTIPLRVELLEIDPLTGPGDIRVYDSNNRLVTVHDPSFHNFTQITQFNVIGRDVRDEVLTYSADAKRNLDFLSFPASVQVGGVRKVQERDRRSTSDVYTYNGPGGNQSPLPYVWPHEALRWDPAGKAAPVLSPYPLVDAWKANPGLLTQTVAQAGTSEQGRRQNSEFIQETADALYFQTEARLLNNRLLVLTGVRYEKTTGEGMGALNVPDDVFVRNANGSFALTSAGARIRRADAGVVGSVEQMKLIWQERAARAKRSYDGYYPSLHLTYNITERLQARAAWARTYGRPNFSFIIPNTVVSETVDGEGDVVGGRLTVRNPGLRPWTADNFDLSLEYYTDQGGAFVAGVFRKDIRDFFGTIDRDATPLELTEAGIDPGAPLWTVRTTENVGSARVDGMELSANQSLTPLDARLGGWGKYFRVFANITKLKLKGDRTADFSGFLPMGINYGIEYSKRPFTASVRANYRSDETSSNPTNIGTNGRIYWVARTHIDVNVSYSLRPNLALFANVRNITNRPVLPYRSSAELPAYAKLQYHQYYGIPFNLGIRGSF